MPTKSEDGWIEAGTKAPAFTLTSDGGEKVREKKKLRFGTRWMMPNGNHFSMREYMDGIGVEIIKDGPHAGYARWKETGVTSLFAWVLSDTLPNPEDFVLARSQTGFLLLPAGVQ